MIYSYGIILFEFYNTQLNKADEYERSDFDDMIDITLDICSTPFLLFLLLKGQAKRKDSSFFSVIFVVLTPNPATVSLNDTF